MKRSVFVIGIGAGNPDFVTIQAVNAIGKADVFFIPNKGAEKDELARVRREIIERHAREGSYRTVEYDTPKRDRTPDCYESAVSDWHDRVEAEYARLITEELGESETGAFLIWGDPTLYDSALRILERLGARADFDLDYEIIPGISAVQALAARHKVAQNNIGRSILITSGRPADEGLPDNIDSMVVMLNAEKALRAADGDLDVYWGAYVGMPDEVLVSGKLRDVLDDIERIRDEARRAKGWIMDTVLLKKPGA
jgi:precorrin-6A synthase